MLIFFVQAQFQHQNFTEYMRSLVYRDVLNEKDIIIQIARCSFDLHVQDIIGTLIIGGTLAMLHPGGIMNFDYLIDVIQNKNVTCLSTVPTILLHLLKFLQQANYIQGIKGLRSVCSAGM